MSNRAKSILIFIVMVLLIGGVYFWFYPLNKGKMEIMTGHSDYSIDVRGESIECPQDPCIVTLETGDHILTIQKDTYYSETIIINIKRGETIKTSVELRKIPTLTVSQIIPKDSRKKSLKELPEELKNLSILAPTWDQTEKKLVFLNLNDNKLKIWEENKDLKVITTLKNIGEGFELYWSPNQIYLFGNIKEDIYFINTSKASRKKQVLDFTPQNIIWSLGSDYLLVNDEANNLYKIDFAQESLEPLPKILNLSNAVWESKDSLIFFSYNEDENKTTIENYNLLSQETEEIITKFNFPLSEIALDANNIIYFYNSDEKTWYYLEN